MNDITPIPHKNSSFSTILPTLQIFWDQTSLGELKLCPQRYKYTIIDGYESRGTNVHLFFGSEYHHAFELFDHLRAVGMPYTDAVYETVKEVLIRTWDKELQRPWVSDNPYKNRHTLLRSVIWYLEKFKNDPLQTIILDNGKPAVEYLFSFEAGCKSSLTGEAFSICGRIDKLVIFEDREAIIDKKTTKNPIDPAFYWKFSPDNQVSAYLIAGGFILNRPVETMLIDAAQILAGSTRFQRGPVYRTPSQLQEWMDDTWIYLEHAEQYAKKNHWPRNDKACNLPHTDPKTGETSYGCPFREVCASDESIRPLLLEANYNKRTWDPIKPKEIQIA